MGQRSVVVIIKGDEILLMHRFCDGKEYFCLPGGGVEEGETVEEAAVREAKEETSFDVTLGRLLWKYVDDFDGRENYFFLVTDFVGQLQLGGPEIERNSAEDNYRLEWHAISDLGKLVLYPEVIKEKIMEEFDK
jgi:8-oxo-dGTP diphosphatase